MTCYEKINKKNKWDYCTFSPDRIFGIYIGCCCKEHDKQYANEGKVTRVFADKKIRRCIINKLIKKGILKANIGYIYWIFCRVFGLFFWKKWSLKGVQKYK